LNTPALIQESETRRIGIKKKRKRKEKKKERKRENTERNLTQPSELE
jgi:hypothetical protein